ncbi:MAG: alkaline phosphatase family protein [Candidatus Hydrothermarchaeales archaeon]
MGRIVIVGLDGVPYRLMEDLSERGVMPNFQSLKKEGIFRKMQSTIPEVSSTAWSSIITGKNPGEHGIFGFMELIEGTYTMSFPDFRNLKAKPFWQMDGKRSVIMNVPSTYPAGEMNGFIVSGFISLDLEKATYPKQYVEKLKALDYRIDVDSHKWYKSQDLFVRELFDTLERRVDAYRYFWNEFRWDLFMLVFTGTDRLGHFLWDAYEESDHKYHDKVIEFFGRIDEVIGEIVERLGEGDSLLMLSDHGFERVKTNVNVNTLLMENGFLELEEAQEKNYTNIKEGTKAFALEPARIYLNKKGKYPRGSVEKEDEESILQELSELFRALEKDDKKVVKKVYRKDEIYSGEYLEKAPDLVLLGEPGFNLRAGLDKDTLFEQDHFKGKHTQDDAFLFVKAHNAEEAVPEEPSVTDVVGILRRMR